MDEAGDGDLESLGAVHRLRERFQGLLLGLAIGDALAAATQYRKPGSFLPVGDLLGGGPFDLPRGAWSDDTAMALCLAESLLEREGFDPYDQMERYLRWQQRGHLSATGDCVGITASVSRALASAAWRRASFSGSDDPQQLDKELLSRVGPAVMFQFADDGQAIEDAARSARCTCQAPLALAACRLFAAMLHAALAGRCKAEVMTPPSALWLAESPSPGLESLLRDEPSAEVGIVAALATARRAFAASGSFRAGALEVVNQGGDSDVHAAVFGQLAGAFYGVSAIPRVWRNSLIRKDLIADMADRLLTAALLGQAGSARQLGGTGPVP